MLLSSKKYQEWHSEASTQIRRQLISSKFAGNADAPRNVQITLFSPDRRKADLTNKAESIMDLLVDNGVLADDNWFNVPSVFLVFGGVEKENPRAEVEIKEIN